MTITATAAGVVQAVSFKAMAAAGAATQVVMARDSLRLIALRAGDTVTALVKDAGDNILPNASVT